MNPHPEQPPRDFKRLKVPGHLLHWARSLDLPPPQKAVLFVMVTYADAGGSCWPSVETIAMGAGTSERNARRLVSDLCERGLVERFIGAGAGTPGRVTNGYLLYPQRGALRVRPGGTDSTKRGDKSRQEGGATCPPNFHRTSIEQPPGSRRVGDNCPTCATPLELPAYCVDCNVSWA